MSEQNEGRALNDVAKWTMIGESGVKDGTTGSGTVFNRNQRPIATQLERIEQDVKAALEGQARLNALVDGLRGDIDKRAHVFRGMEAGITKLSNELPPAFLGLYDRLTAIEAKLDEAEERATREVTAQVSAALSSKLYHKVGLPKWWVQDAEKRWPNEAGWQDPRRASKK